MLLLVLSLTLYWLNQKRHMDSLLSDKVIAIFPFTVRGSTDLNLLQEGMIDLLFINLNHAGELRSVDPHALLNQVKLLSKSDLNLQDAKKIAQFFGAGFYIIGSIFIAQGRLRCNATLYKTRGNETTAQFIVAEAPVDRSLDLVDDITKQIIAKYSKAPADRKQLLGAMTTQSWPALKAYLEGLQADRGGRFREAYDLYNSAVKQDSSFALAWLLLSELNRGFLFRHEEAQAALYQASLHSDKLSLHERRLLTIQQALLDGEHDKVLKGCRQIVDENPDDIFGWDGLATYWQQVASLLGYSILECKPAFARLLSLDPENATNYQQRLVIANRQGKIDEIDSLIAKLKQLSPNHEWAWPMVIPRAYMTDNPVARQKVLQEAENQSNIILKNGPVMCAVWGKDLRNVIPLTRKLLDRSRPQETQATGYLMLAVLELSQGKWRTAREKLDSLNSYDPNYMHAFCGLFSPVYYYHAQKPDLRQVYKDVIDWQASTKTQQGDTENDFMPLVSLLPQIRWYYLGLLTAFNGDSSQTAVFCRNLLSKKTPHEAKSLIRIWVATLQALIARGNHYDNAALELLAKEPVIMRFPFYWGPVYSTAFSRYLRAELLYRLGRNEEALNWYRSLAEIYFYDLPYRAPAAFKIAEICENAGRREEAIHEYERFLALWRDCDPEFKPMTAVAEKRLVELKKWGE
jgi:tetratricopeptide (TPR) repeat protein